jgi:bifunctional DNase/RNase
MSKNKKIKNKIQQTSSFKRTETHALSLFFFKMFKFSLKKAELVKV